ncbi:hypothetical protein BDZ94DRAFT_1239342 [Collybia nuda]|uniref:NAD(P)-binding protein n=1 Tax=Collybia nuda TaxID=64659 RepID=A0A9P5XZ98_9AGAR|nr:hypothetical protein BDZ94DRAFT_1239342 [Collybia nuda]
MSHSREELISRTLPYMVLSDASNPLTASIPEDPSLIPSSRAIERFSVKGNAIGFYFNQPSPYETNSCYLVTGGAGALGIESARALLEHGLSGLCLFDVTGSLNSSQVAINNLRADFPSSKIFTENVDVTDDQAIDSAVQRTVQSFGKIDVLLCFAGVVGCTHATEVNKDEWRRILDINTTGSWLCAQAVGKQMIQQASGGSIVFTASISAHRVNYPQPQVAYNVSKGALLQLKSSLAAEWARYGIRVNSISPGYMDTILNAGEGLEGTRHIWAARNPMGRMGDPSELVGAVILLCSPAGRYINGADILVDGMWRINRILNSVLDGPRYPGEKAEIN